MILPVFCRTEVRASCCRSCNISTSIGNCCNFCNSSFFCLLFLPPGLRRILYRAAADPAADQLLYVRSFGGIFSIQEILRLCYFIEKTSEQTDDGTIAAAMSGACAADVVASLSFVSFVFSIQTQHQSSHLLHLTCRSSSSPTLPNGRSLRCGRCAGFSFFV